MFPKAKIIAGLVFMCVAVVSSAQDNSDILYFQSFFQSKNPPPLETALLTASMRLEQAREIRDPREEATALKTLGLLHLTRVHDYEKAMDFFIKCLAIEDSISLESERLLTYIAIARVFETVGDYYKSAEFLEQGLALRGDHVDINVTVLMLNSLGKVKASLGKITEAFDHYQQVLRYKDDIDKRFEAEALFNLAHLYTLQGRYQEALKSHRKALAIKRQIDDRDSEALSLNDIGELYHLMSNDEKSLANHLVALEIRQTLKDKRGMAESYNNVGRLYSKQQNYQQAITHGLMALESGREAQAQEQIFRSYELLSRSYKELHDYKSALTYAELSLAIHEFIQNEKQERQLLETQNRYVIGRKETEIEKLQAVRAEREKEIAAQKEFRNVLFLLSGLCFIIAILIFILYLVKRRSNHILQTAKDEVELHNNKLQELNATKDKFFSIISHDLKGPLNSLTSFSHLLIEHTDNMSKEEIQMLAKDLDKSLKNLFTLLENLLEWSRSQTGSIDFTPDVFDLAEILESNKNLLQAQAANKGINISVDSSASCLVRLHKPSITTVVRNLLSNAIKFTSEGGRIVLGIERAAGSVNVYVKDNGVGMSKEVVHKLFRLDQKHSSKGTANEKGTGLGLILCKEFVEKNGGEIQVHSTPGQGSVFRFSFPEVQILARKSTSPVPASFSSGAF